MSQHFKYGIYGTTCKMCVFNSKDPNQHVHPDKLITALTFTVTFYSMVNRSITLNKET